MAAVAQGREWAYTEGTIANAEASRTREFEATYGETGVKAGADPYGAVADIRRTADLAQEAATAANDAARGAVNAYRDAREVNWRVALDAAAADVLRLRTQARVKAEMDANRPKSWQQRAMEAVKHATKPYLDSLEAAQQSAWQ